MTAVLRVPGPAKVQSSRVCVHLAEGATAWAFASVMPRKIGGPGILVNKGLGRSKGFVRHHVIASHIHRVPHQGLAKIENVEVRIGCRVARMMEVFAGELER